MGLKAVSDLAAASGGIVNSVTGTANQITASPTTGAVILSLPGVLNIPGTETILGAGAASTAQSLWSGVVFTGGTGTTTFPAAFLQPAGTTAATTWSTSGTGLGMNLTAGFAGNFLDFRIGGAGSVFSVTSGGSITMSGQINLGSTIFAGNGSSSAAWTTSGRRIQFAASTFTDTTSSGTVAAQYINAFKAPTVAASSATTFTNSYNTYFEDPVAGSNVTQTNKWGLGADSARIGGTMISTTGLITTANTTMIASSVALTNGAAAQIATMTNGPTAGNPTKWIPINDNGTTRYIPAW